MLITSGLISSNRRDWATPWDFFDLLDAVYHFDLDVCAEAYNAKCARFFSPAKDGLAQEWRGTCWMNPPYGREVGKWTAKARDAGEHGVVVVCFLPARTETQWWHRDVMGATWISFVPGRVKFEGARYNAPFPSAIVVFGPGAKPPYPTVVSVEEG